MRQLTILAVDDDPDDLEIFKETLLEVGHNVNLIIAYDGHEALDQLSKLHPKPDIIFLDFNMPMMDGKHCLMKLKSDSSLMHIPVVMHSTTFSEEDIAFYHAHDAKTLTKQTVYSKMVTELASILAESRNKVNAM